MEDEKPKVHQFVRITKTWQTADFMTVSVLQHSSEQLVCSKCGATAEFGSKRKPTECIA